MFKVRPKDNVVLESCLGCFQIPIRNPGDKPFKPIHIGNNCLKTTRLMRAAELARAAKMAAFPVKAPREALTGKAAFQAAGYRRRGARRTGGYWHGERGEPVGAHRGANGQDAREPQCPTRGAICVPRMGQYASHAWDWSSPSGEAGREARDAADAWLSRGDRPFNPRFST